MPNNRPRRPPLLSRPRNTGVSSSTSGGPLMTDHLQLRDLDLELELLKRKREIIEQQQQILASEQQYGRMSQFDYKRQRDYSPLGYDEPSYSQNRGNYSNFYEDRPSLIDSYSRQASKRPADDWQSQSCAPKRFNSSASGLRDKRPANRPLNKPQPLMSQPIGPPRISPRPSANGSTGKALSGKTRSTSRSRDFKLAKVSKPQPIPAPNKLNSYPIAERKNLTAQASTLANKNEVPVYHAGKAPSSKVHGRLELVLGSFVKGLKDEYGEKELYSNVFVSVPLQRALKQGFRDRIHEVMAGKPVGSSHEVMAHYRERYPKETDFEVLHAVLKANKDDKQDQPSSKLATIPPPVKLAIVPIQTGNPEKFFKFNFNKLVHLKLEEMFSKLYELYQKEESQQNKQEMINEIIQEEQNRKNAQMEVGNTEKVENTAGKEDNGVDKDSAADKKQTAEDEEGSDKINEDNAEVKEKDILIREENAAEAGDRNTEETAATDKETSEDKENIANKDKIDSGENKSADNADKKTETNSSTENQNNSEPEVVTTVTEVIDEPKRSIESLEESDLNRVDTRVVVPDHKANVYDKIMAALLSRRLPKILPKFRYAITNLLNVDEMYKQTKAYIIMETNAKAQKIADAAKARNEAKEEANPEPNQPTPSPSRSPVPYFVKIMGRPGLPKRKLMQTFLDQFHPASIKKHRGIHNLLFVGFTDKTDLQNILAANRTVIGNNILDIKVSEKATPVQENKPQPQEESKTVNGSDVVMAEACEGKNDTTSTETNQVDQATPQTLETVDEEMAPVEDTTKVKLEPKEEPKENSNGEDKLDEAVDNTADGITNDIKVEKETVEEETEVIQTNKDDEESPKSNADAPKTVTAPATPTRASTRLANAPPGSVRTTRASRLAQNQDH